MTAEEVREFLKPLVPLATEYAVKIVGVLILLWIAMSVSGALGRRVTGTLDKRDFDKTLSIFFGNMTRWGILAAAVVAILGVFGLETTSFAAILGAAGVAIGLGFQGTLSSFAAGVLLLVFRPFKVGDFVKVAGQMGTVVEIGLFTVALDTLDNRRVIVPNAEVAGKIIENVSHNDKRRVDIDVGAAYDASIPETREALERAAMSLEQRDEELGHQVFLKGLGGSSVDWQVRVWCDAAEYWPTWEATIEAIKRELEGAEISIPFPQMDVHLDGALGDDKKAA